MLISYPVSFLSSSFLVLENIFTYQTSFKTQKKTVSNQALQSYQHFLLLTYHPPQRNSYFSAHYYYLFI